MATDVSICNRAIQKVGGQPITSLSGASETARACNRVYSEIRDEELRSNNWNFSIKRTILSCEKTITGVSTASLAVFTTSAAHGFSVGDYVYIKDLVWTTGNPVPDGIYVIKTTPLTTTFTLTDDGVDVSTTGYTYSSGGTVNASAAYSYTAAFDLPSDCLRVISINNYYGVMENIGSYGMIESDFNIENNKIYTIDSSDIEVKYVSQVTDVSKFDSLFREALECKIAIEICEVVTEDKPKKDRLWNDYTMAIRRARQCDSIESPGEPIEECSWLLSRV